MNESSRISEVIGEITALIGRSGKAETVFGEPREILGKVIIPAASVRGGAGGGGGSGEGHAGGAVTSSDSDPQASGGGMGAGAGLETRPLGWLIVSNHRVHFQPVIDVSKMAIIGAAVGVFALMLTKGMLGRYGDTHRRGHIRKGCCQGH